MTSLVVEQLIDAYLNEVAAALPGPAPTRVDIVGELRSVLLDATDSYTSADLPPAAAVKTAISELGDPHDVAASYRPELVAKQARRFALELVVAAAAIGLLWAHAAQRSDPAIHGASPWRLLWTPPVPFAAAALLLAITTALLTLAMTGRPTRWLSDRPRAAALTVALGGFGSAAADLIIIVLLVSQLVSAPHGFALLPLTVAGLASATRFFFAQRAAHECLACRPSANLPALHLLQS
jgi:hypothetical protein